MAAGKRALAEFCQPPEVIALSALVSSLHFTNPWAVAPADNEKAPLALNRYQSRSRIRLIRGVITESADPNSADQRPPLLVHLWPSRASSLIRHSTFGFVI